MGTRRAPGQRDANQLAQQFAELDTPPSRGQIWYGHSILTSTIFPANKPADSTVAVSQTSGNIEFVLEPAVNDTEDGHVRAFPYGKYPRLIMAWFAKQIRMAKDEPTEFVEPETRTIRIPSIKRLCKELGVQHGGKTARIVLEQLNNLLGCHISARSTTGFEGNRLKLRLRKPVHLFDQYAEIEDLKDAANTSVEVVMAENIWNQLREHTAPYDSRAAAWLLHGRSVMPYDVYIWAASSTYGLSHPLPVSWEWLFDRFGEGFTNEKGFRMKFREALEDVVNAYPALRIEVPPRGSGVVLYPSPLALTSSRP